MEEVWKDIKGYEGLYQVSNLGNVKNVKTQKQLYKNYNKINDYLFVSLGRHKKKYIHRLVYETFKGFNNEKNIINHKNSIKTDNRLENLEECSYSYNLIYAYYNGERKLKPVNQYSIDGKLINHYITGKEASEKTGVCRSNICNCCKGRKKQAGGYIWRYADIKQSPKENLIRIINELTEQLDKEKEKNEELDKIKFIITDKLPPDMKYVCYCNTDFERLFGNDYISKDKIKEKIEEIKDRKVEDKFISATTGKLNTIIELEKLLEEGE